MCLGSETSRSSMNASRVASMRAIPVVESSRIATCSAPSYRVVAPVVLARVYTPLILRVLLRRHAIPQRAHSTRHARSTPPCPGKVHYATREQPTPHTRRGTRRSHHLLHAAQVRHDRQAARFCPSSHRGHGRQHRGTGGRVRVTFLCATRQSEGAPDGPMRSDERPGLPPQPSRQPDRSSLVGHRLLL